MGRVILFHWNDGEARERAARLRRAGHAPEVIAAGSVAAVRALRAHPPDAFVIDLDRIPSRGRALAVMLRQQPATRRVPIVFVAGEPEKVARVRALLPDATYVEWSGIRPALRRALARPPAQVVVPGTMDSYAGTPLPKRLGLRAGAVVSLLGAPRGFARTLDALPPGVRLHTRGRAGSRVILLFVKRRAALARRFAGAARKLAEHGGIWIVWPKQASGVSTDLTMPAVRAFGLRSGFVDYKVCAIDATWSGLLFTRRSDRAAKRG